MTTFTPSNNSAANNSATRRSVNEPSHKTAFEHLRSVLLRGGRMTKFKGMAASIAPMMGVDLGETLVAAGNAVSSQLSKLTGRLSTRLASGASVAALSAIMLAAPALAPITLTGGAGQAIAGTCTETGGAGSGIWTCTGPAGADTTQAPTSAPGGTLDVSTAAGFGITTAAGSAIQLYSNGTDLTFRDNNVSTITGLSTGISAYSGGTGTITITSTGTATATAAYGAGIRVSTNNSTGDVNLTAVDTVGGGFGIDVENRGQGSTTVTSTGTATATGAYDAGISISNYFFTTDLTLNAVDTMSGGSGIRTVHQGTGLTTITTTGTTTGTNGDGIRAHNRTSTSGMSLDIGGAVTGGEDGIDAVHHGTGTLAVTAANSVTGGSGYGIATRTDYAAAGNVGMTSITLNAGAAVSSTAGLAIYNDAGASTTTVNTGASVTGQISLNDGSDDLTFAGGDFTGVTLFDGGDDLLTADGFIDTLSFTGSSGAVAGATVVNWEEVHVGAGSTISFSDGMLSAGAITEPTTGLYVDAGGILDQGGIGLDLMGNLSNLGIVTTQDGTAGDTITVSGNYTGGGQLLVDVVLGDDTSATDTLVIEGDVSGMTDVVVANVGGTGAQTTAGILVVDVNGASPADGFVLANGVPLGTGENGLIAGAYAYAWRQIGSDWYLQSMLSPTGGTRLFNPDSAVYEVYPQTLLGMMTLPTMQQRVGNRYWKEAGPAPVQQTVYCKDPAMNFECAVNNELADYYADKAKEQARMDDGAIWARVEGAHNHVEPVSSTSGVSSYETDQWRLQAGIDGLAHESGKGDRLFVGINGSYGTASSQISSAFDSGSIDTTAYSLGATATWLATNGIYVDLQGSYAWFDSDLSSDMAAIGSLVDGNDGTGYALSAEVGKKIDVGNNWTFTPQAQLTYASVDFDSFTGPSGEAVSLGDADSLKLRLGISADRDASWTDDNGMKQRAHLYAIANVIHDFSPKSTVLVTGTPLTSERDAWTGEVGLGFTRNFNDDKYSVYGEVNAATGLENFGDSYKLGGTLGVRVSF